MEGGCSSARSRTSPQGSGKCQSCTGSHSQMGAARHGVLHSHCFPPPAAPAPSALQVEVVAACSVAAVTSPSASTAVPGALQHPRAQQSMGGGEGFALWRPGTAREMHVNPLGAAAQKLGAAPELQILEVHSSRGLWGGEGRSGGEDRPVVLDSALCRNCACRKVAALSGERCQVNYLISPLPLRMAAV